jgi:hypothetical protein
MIRTAVKLAFVALLANATWQVFNAYWPHYKFKDAVTATTQYRGDKTDDQVRARILELAAQFDLPVMDETLTLRREDKHTIVDTSYEHPVEFFPGYIYKWPFTLHVDTYTLAPPKLDELPLPK